MGIHPFILANILSTLVASLTIVPGAQVRLESTSNSRLYFLVVFKKSDSQNNIWKLGEPFISHFQFTFDQEKKELGFYNPNLKKIPNDIFMKNLGEEKMDKKILQKNWHLFVIIVILFGLLVALAYFLGKKLNENRKKRANELNDDDFDYSSDKKNNDNDGLKENSLIVN